MFVESVQTFSLVVHYCEIVVHEAWIRCVILGGVEVIVELHFMNRVSDHIQGQDPDAVVFAVVVVQNHVD